MSNNLRQLLAEIDLKHNQIADLFIEEIPVDVVFHFPLTADRAYAAGDDKKVWAIDAKNLKRYEIGEIIAHSKDGECIIVRAVGLFETANTYSIYEIANKVEVAPTLNEFVLRAANDIDNDLKIRQNMKELFNFDVGGFMVYDLRDEEYEEYDMGGDGRIYIDGWETLDENGAPTHDADLEEISACNKYMLARRNGKDSMYYILKVDK